ncbi:MAG: hypothetical protein EOP50_14830 [Sphingobacteriales bacterium]|nr:MAG: hypothetical protein EOP50_14830 [Sphingobacteriales bacterium]
MAEAIGENVPALRAATNSNRGAALRLKPWAKTAGATRRDFLIPCRFLWLKPQAKICRRYAPVQPQTAAQSNN